MQQDANVHRVVPRRRATFRRALRKEAFRLVEDEHGVLCLGLYEHFLDVLCRLADVLVHELRTVHHHQGSADIEADGLGGHRLASARITVEEGRDALRPAVLLLEAPLAEEHCLRLGKVDNVLELLLDLRRQDHLLQAVLRHDPAVEVGHRQPTSKLMRRSRMQVCHGERWGLAIAGHRNREGGEPSVLDKAALKLVLAREQHEIDVVCEREFGRCHRSPNALAKQQVGLSELDSQRDAPVHRLVQVHRSVGGEDAKALMPLELRQDGVDLQIALGTIHEDALTLVKEQDRVVDLSLAEDEL
mmetsp:Transcript_55125/g.109461  ORF Transcript_55125/g.109461 Transcript_55125/m.109461 type:complete len:302 (+) Transcript_55125:841-1746(+)